MEGHPESSECSGLESTTTVAPERYAPPFPLNLAGTGTELADTVQIVQQVEAMMNQAASAANDVVIIGGGPGGYVAAVRAAQLGGKVVLIEKDELGGVCLNRGCIPTKAMLSSADTYDIVMRRSADHGITVTGATLDFSKVIDRRQRVVKQLVSGVGVMMKAHKVQVIKGTARLASRNSVAVSMPDGTTQEVAGRNIIIATGSEPVPLPIPGLDGPNIWDSDGALAATEVPKRLLVIGGGVIGVEWGYMFHRFGSEVTIVELMHQILPLNEDDVAAELQKSFVRAGIKVLIESRVTSIEHGPDGATATVVTGDSEQKITVDKVMVAVGRRPIVEGLGIESLGINFDRKGIKADDHMRTNVPGIYAIGDVVGGMLLAHKASEEGVVAAENCMGRDSTMKYNSLPATVYTTPEVASVGMTENYVKEQGIDYKVGRFDFRINGKALGMGEREGFVKIIADAKYGEVLGCHMIGPHATDLIHEVVVGMDAEATADVIGRAVHAHPTLSEVVKEAALDVNGEAIHKVR